LRKKSKSQANNKKYNWIIQNVREEIMYKKLITGFICAVAAGFCLAQAANEEVKGRIVHFPKDHSLGQLQIRDHGSQRWQDWKDFGTARGEVFVPEGKVLHLALEYGDYESFRYLPSLGPNDLQELVMHYEHLSDKDLTNIKGLTGLESLDIGAGCIGTCPLTGDGLVNLQGMKNLRSLSINFSNITDDKLIFLSKLKTLEKLQLHSNKKITGEGLVNLKDLMSLRELVFWSTPINNDALKNIGRFSSLEVLNLEGTNVTDEGLVYISNLPKLKVLTIIGNNTDAGLSNLKESKHLEDLVFFSPEITDKGLANLKDIPTLKKLSISTFKVTREGIEDLLKVKPNLEISFSLSAADDEEMAKVKGRRCTIIYAGPKVTDAGLANLEGMNSLKELYLINNTRFTAAGLNYLKDLNKLEWLDLRDTQITDEGLAYLKGLSSLKRLDLSNTKVGDAGLVHIKELKSLDSLFLSDTQVTDTGLVNLKDLNNLVLLFLERTNITGDGLAHLKGIKSLRTLDLQGIIITDAAVEHLKEMTWLQSLNINTTGISDEAFKKLEKALPNCTIYITNETDEELKKIKRK
jgi:Leucine-rich repeat (LRR) protein